MKIKLESEVEYSVKWKHYKGFKWEYYEN